MKEDTVEDVRPYRVAEEKKEREEDHRRELEAAKSDEEVPFHVPRD
ncbi:MAG TPA: hypothetical protein VFT12_13035 [Thermoanaerobaculia bacterium]|nr:hypothetical protein [Thermoanaerobaculia bacterium]